VGFDGREFDGDFDYLTANLTEGLSMNSPARVIGFVNAAHFIVIIRC